MDVPTVQTASTVPAQTTYHARRGLIIMASVVLFFICCGFIPLLVSTLVNLPTTSATSTLWGPLVSAVLLACIVAAFVIGYVAILRMRIVTSAEGIAFYCLLYHLTTTWKNIAGISERINRQGRRYKVLELGQRAETFAANRWLGFITSSLNRPGSYIPLDYFITLGKEDSSRLLAEIKSHAGEREAEKATKKKKSRGKNS